MKLKAPIKYYLRDTLNSVGIYYIIILCIFLFVTTMSKSNSSGTDMATAIFLFVCGLNAFKGPFYMMRQNNQKRRSIWTGFLISSVMVCLSMAVIDTLLYIVFGAITGGRISMLYPMLYGHRLAAVSPFVLQLEGVAWAAMLNLMAMTIGYAISLLYYRMNKILKLCVSIGVPALFIYATAYTQGGLILQIGRMFGMVYPNAGAGPLLGQFLLVSLAVAAVCAGASYLLIRRAPVKA